MKLVAKSLRVLPTEHNLFVDSNSSAGSIFADAGTDSGAHTIHRSDLATFEAPRGRERDVSLHDCACVNGRWWNSFQRIRFIPIRQKGEIGEIGD